MNNEKKSFILSIITIGLLMLFTYGLTFIIDCKGIKFYEFIASPLLVLGSSSGATTIAVIIFLLIIGGITNGMNKCGVMEYMLNKFALKYSKHRYKLMFSLVFFLMLMGSIVGTFEEVVPLTPIIVALSIRLGFDAFTGLSISILAAGCGFAAGLFNPFTIGVAQQLAGLPMFSGVSLRLLSFVLIYALLMAFICLHTKRIKKDIITDSYNDFTVDENMEKALKAFVVIFSIAIIIVLFSPIIVAIQDYTLIIVALMFLIAGLVSIKIANVSNSNLNKYFKEGVISVLPSIALILMAASIKYIMDESGILDSVLLSITQAAMNMNKVELILFVYLFCLLLEIFVPSGSAKAFLIMPLLTPLAVSFGLSKQLCVLAFAYGDGFSNVFYPTNPALIISLSLTKVSYKEWFKYSGKFQIVNLLLTIGILLFGLAIGY